jgi:hypothetical protein
MARTAQNADLKPELSLSLVPILSSSGIASKAIIGGVVGSVTASRVLTRFLIVGFVVVAFGDRSMKVGIRGFDRSDAPTIAIVLATGSPTLPFQRIFIASLALYI